MSKDCYYAVRHGRKPGIYYNWPDCNSQVLAFKGAVFKKFKSLQEANDFIDGGLKTPPISPATNTDSMPPPQSTTTNPQKRKRSKASFLLSLLDENKNQTISLLKSLK